MAFFQTLFIDHLYVAGSNTGDRGFIALVIPLDVDTKGDPIGLQEALSSVVYQASFVFCALAPSITDATGATTFVESIYGVLRAANAERAMIWLQDHHHIDSTTASIMGIDTPGRYVNSGLLATLANGLQLSVANGIDLHWKDDYTLWLDGTINHYQIGFAGPASPTAQPVYVGTLTFSGPQRGTIQFTTYIQRQSLFDAWHWGFQLLSPKTEASGASFYEGVPLAAADPGSTDLLGFNVNIDPSDVFNKAYDACISGACTLVNSYASRRTWLAFTGTNSDNVPTVLASFYRTIYGARVNLQPLADGTNVLPARLVFCYAAYSQPGPRPTETFLAGPEGDFALQVPSVTDGSRQYLMGGLQGTELFMFTSGMTNASGDMLRFISRRPANAPDFPFEQASPVKTPQRPDAPLLTDTFTTSWATLIAGGAIPLQYMAQPKGSALFGSNSLVGDSYPELFGHCFYALPFQANDTISFPLLPYAGVYADSDGPPITADQIAAIESQVVSPVRRQYVGQLSTALSQTRLTGDGTTTRTTTTPSGMLVNLTTGTGGALHWNTVLLGQNTDDGKDFRLAFVDPDARLVEALQTGDLLLVATDAKHLGSLDAAAFGEPAFQHKMSIGSWEMSVKVGEQNKYNDYRNVMIIKAKKGKLYDRATPAQGLLANPSKWTQKEAFAATDQLVILSQWLQSYCEQAAGMGDNPYFERFNALVQDDTWTGILFLRADISGLPQNLIGIRAGITAPEAFNVHHLAVDISAVRKTGDDASLDKPSTISGLIYYVDPAFTDDGSDKPLAPTTANDYDFRLLTLKVLFENTAVRSFESLAQLTLNSVLDMPVSRMGDAANLYNNVLLRGSLQINGNQTNYSLSSQGSDSFYCDHNIIHKVQVLGVQLSTRNDNVDAQASTWFAISGFIDYCVVSEGESTFDVFSFGNLPGEDLPNRGLKFSNLGILMVFPPADPRSKTMIMDETQMSFDTSRSTPRPDCLYLNFALDLQGLVEAAEEDTVGGMGYLPVIPGVALADPGAGGWYGLRYRLNLGTPGELAGKVNLDAYLLTAWSVTSGGKSGGTSGGGSGYKGAIGLALPGAGGGAPLISLQTVLKLSIGQIRLVYVEKQSSFLLMITEIALQFLGLLKIPPNGSTLFYLFGNPYAGGKASGLGWYAMYKQKKPTETFKSPMP